MEYLYIYLAGAIASFLAWAVIFGTFGLIKLAGVDGQVLAVFRAAAYIAIVIANLSILSIQIFATFLVYQS